MESLLHRIFQRDIAIAQIGGEGTSAHAILIVMKAGRCLKGILAHPFIRLLIVKIPYPLYIRIR